DLEFMWRPSLSQHLLITALIRAGPLNLEHLGVSISCSLAAGILLAWIAIRLYGRERLLD
ncbi:MAG: hypothetical protein VCC36_00030, partial [Gammaproteobacteria bacterium]